MRRIMVFAVTSLLVLLTFTCFQAKDKDVAGRNLIRLPPGSLLASDFTNQRVSAPGEDGETTGDSLDIRTDKIEDFPFRLYVTPRAPAITALSAQVSRPEEAYEMAVQWVYVPENRLNGTADKWLTPQEFLTETPCLPGNPLQGREVGDCEEQANALASLIRAGGIPPEEVRVAVGEIIINDEKQGHVWVELFMDGRWLVLDPTCGPYWDDEAGKLIRREGASFDHYFGDDYPALDVWAYYNDVYFLDLTNDIGDAPTSWR